jgi:hypothetical protein
MMSTWEDKSRCWPLYLRAYVHPRTWARDQETKLAMGLRALHSHRMPVRASPVGPRQTARHHHLSDQPAEAPRQRGRLRFQVPSDTQNPARHFSATRPAAAAFATRPTTAFATSVHISDTSQASIPHCRNILYT